MVFTFIHTDALDSDCKTPGTPFTKLPMKQIFPCNMRLNIFELENFVYYFTVYGTLFGTKLSYVSLIQLNYSINLNF